MGKENMSESQPRVNGTIPVNLAGEAFRAWLELRLQLNERVLSQYGIILGVLILIFAVSRLIHAATSQSYSQTSRSAFLMPLVAVSRAARRICIRKAPGFPSVGHATLVTIYLAINIIISFTRIDFEQPTNVSARLGWMAAGNMVLVVFLALKNTPLAVLTAYSYEHLNCLHQAAGYTTLIQTILHGVVYTWYFASQSRWEILHSRITTAGVVLGFALLVSVLAGTFLQRRNYELFYVIHVTMFLVIVVALGLHRPQFDERILIPTLLMAAMWFSDHLIRVARMVYNSYANEVTLCALPNGATRLVMKKSVFRARPGKHCYVWLPRIRLFESHPFTIVASDPLELVINSCSGFTRALHAYAAEYPGASMASSVEGPYGTIPDPLEYDNVVLFAGGSGATFTFGMLSSMLTRATESSKQFVTFVWAVRMPENLAWFDELLKCLCTHSHAPHVSLQIYHTGVSSGSTGSWSSSSDSQTAHMRTGDAHGTAFVSPALTSRDETKAVGKSEVSHAMSERRHDPEALHASENETITTGLTDIPIRTGRPDIGAIINNVVRPTNKNQRILVAVCGPAGMVKNVRNETAKCISVTGPSIELYCEQFGW